MPFVDNLKKCVFKHAKEERETEQMRKWIYIYIYMYIYINIKDSVYAVLDYIFINATFKGAILGK